jgi:hypothetical protein
MTVAQHEQLTWFVEWDVHKFDQDTTTWLTERLGRDPQFADFVAAGLEPYDIGHVEPNLLTTAGLDRITKLITATGSPQALTNTSGRIGVGNGAGTAAVGDTDLSAAAGAANRYFTPFDASYPQQANGVITIFATFAGANGNFAWNEFGIDIGTPTVAGGTTVNAVLLNHKTSIAQGTKISGQAWTAQATITIA